MTSTIVWEPGVSEIRHRALGYAPTASGFRLADHSNTSTVLGDGVRVLSTGYDPITGNNSPQLIASGGDSTGDMWKVGLVTTHDLALAQIVDELAPRSAKVHFDDQLEAGKMTFEYRLRPGVVQRSHAMELMRSVGLGV